MSIQSKWAVHSFEIAWQESELAGIRLAEKNNWREYAWRDFAWREYALRDFAWRENAYRNFAWRENELKGIWNGRKIEYGRFKG